MDKIVRVLENHQVVLMKDIAMLDQMYDLNTKYYKELTMYIIAGKKRLEHVRAHDLEELKKKAAETGAQEDAQKYNDYANLCNRFEKKLHDLELTRMISIQMGPQTPADPEQRHPDGWRRSSPPWSTPSPCGRARWCWPWGWSTADRPRRPRAQLPT